MASVGERRARSPTRVFFVSPSHHLVCSLCDVNFNEVVLPCAGGHTFCRACVVRWFARQRTCPDCRFLILASFTAATLPANRLAKAQIDELRVRCRFGVKEEGDGWVADEAGCPAQLSLDGAAAHEAVCGFATTTCHFAGCGVELRRSDVTSHNATCVHEHLDGERTARLADAARLAAVESRLLACEQLSSFAARASVAPRMLSTGWAEHKTVTTSADQEDEAEMPAACGCAFSPDSSSVCVVLADGQLHVLDCSSGDYSFSLEGHEGPVYTIRSCAFSPNGSLIASGTGSRFVTLWNAVTGDIVRTLEGHTKLGVCCAFSPDGRSIFVPDLATRRSSSGTPKQASI